MDTVVVPASPAPRGRVNTVNLAMQIGDRTGVEAIVCLPTWGRTITALQAELLGAHALGVRRIVCETGSAPPLGDYPGVEDVREVDTVRLIALLRALNEGRDHNGIGLSAATTFEIGARVAAGARGAGGGGGRTALRKVAAGAQFLVTRPGVRPGLGAPAARARSASPVPLLALGAPAAQLRRGRLPGARGPGHGGAGRRAGRAGAGRRRRAAAAGVELAVELRPRAADRWSTGSCWRCPTTLARCRPAAGRRSRRVINR